MRLDAGARRASAAAGDAIALHVGAETIVVDELLVATGRRPNTDDLGLETVGLEPGGPLAVDDTGLVDGVDGQWLYAAGDVTGRAPLTHQGKYDARIVGRGDRAPARPGEPVGHRAVGRARRRRPTTRAVPQVVFTDPEVAVGRADRGAGARRPGCDVRVVDLPIAVAGSTLQADGYDGAARMVVDEDRGGARRR